MTSPLLSNLFKPVHSPPTYNKVIWWYFNLNRPWFVTSVRYRPIRGRLVYPWRSRAKRARKGQRGFDSLLLEGLLKADVIGSTIGRTVWCSAWFTKEAGDLSVPNTESFAPTRQNKRKSVASCSSATTTFHWQLWNYCTRPCRLRPLSLCLCTLQIWPITTSMYVFF